VTSNLNPIHVSLNLLTGCTKKSAGCVNCYAERHARRLSEDADPNVAWKYRKVFTLTEHPELLSKNIGGSPKLIFLNSMSDTFHDDVSKSFMERTFDFVRRHPQHIFQVLTKRAERLSVVVDYPTNVWLGVTVEKAEYLYRIDYLVETNAKVKWVSFEPLLGPINSENIRFLDWAVVGGESGPRCRPMDLDWARGIKGDCEKYGVPFFFKQRGGPGRDKGGDLLDGEKYKMWPASLSNCELTQYELFEKF
jgi:protein gp37